MKILILHSNYQIKGGEEAVFEQEYNLLSQDLEVKKVSFANLSGWRGAVQFFTSVWNLNAARNLKKIIVDFKPDLIHIHNWHYAFGPTIIRVIKREKVPIIVTLHNYRLLCPSGALLHNGTIFLDSVHASFPWLAVKNKVYRRSYLQTFWLAFIIWIHKKVGTWKMVNRYLVLTKFAKEVYLNSTFGIPSNQISVKPNFVIKQNSNLEPRQNHFLFIGRLSVEKGISFLLEAFKGQSYHLKVAGDGPMLPDVLQACKENSNIQYLGKLDKQGVNSVLQQCSALLFPSIWYEGMPMTILEAFSFGTPVIASNLGAMASMIQHNYNGLHFEPGVLSSLFSQLKRWVEIDEAEKQRFYHNALNTYEKSYTPERNKELLIEIYRKVIEENSAIT